VVPTVPERRLITLGRCHSGVMGAGSHRHARQRLVKPKSKRGCPRVGFTNAPRFGDQGEPINALVDMGTTWIPEAGPSARVTPRAGDRIVYAMDPEADGDWRNPRSSTPVARESAR